MRPVHTVAGMPPRQALHVGPRLFRPWLFYNNNIELSVLFVSEFLAVPRVSSPGAITAHLSLSSTFIIYQLFLSSSRRRQQQRPMPALLPTCRCPQGWRSARHLPSLTPQCDK